MADNVTIPATGSGTATPVIATDDVSGVHYQIVKTTIGALDAAGSLLVGGAGAVAAGVQRTTLASDDPAVASLGIMDDWDSTDACKTVGIMSTVTVTVTRAANTTTYTSGDAVGTSAAGGVVMTSMARVSGGSGIITDMFASWDDVTVTKMQGEVWIFDSTFTVTADNGAFTCTDAEAKTLVAIIPFVLTAGPSQDLVHVQNLSIGYTAVGSANLYMAVVIRSASIPIANSSILTFRFKVVQA